MSLKSGTGGSACAVCKYQRRKCSPACVLAPYFPADQPNNFRNAHRLFGVSNIVKLLKMVDDSHKADAMNSIIYQAYIRERYPAHGCLGVILQLNYQIWHMEEELHAVRSQLDVFRQQQNQLSDLTTTEDVPWQQPLEFELGMAPPSNTNDCLTLFTHDYDEMLPLFDTIDDRQSYIDSKGAYVSSSEESLKDATQSVEYVAENELKSAAACFSLTSVNSCRE